MSRVSTKKPVPTRPAQLKRQTAALVPVPRPLRSPAPNQPSKGTGAHFAHSVCAITDPFCKEAVGSKWPDVNATPTLAYQGRGRTILPSENGRAAMLFYPEFNRQMVRGVYVAGTDFTFIGGRENLTQNGFASTTGYRVVSWGLRIQNIAAPMVASGTVHVRLFNDTANISSDSINVAGYSCIAAYDIALQDCHDLIVVPERTGIISTQFSVPFDPAAPFQDVPRIGWTHATVAVTGTEAAFPVSIEMVVNYELTFTDGDSLNRLMTPASTSSPLLAQASAVVSKSIGNFVKGGAEVVHSLAVAAGRKAALSILGPVGGTIAGGMLALTVD